MKTTFSCSKYLMLFATFLISVSAFAIPKDPCAPKDVCCEDPKAGPFAFSYPKDLGLACPRDFYVHGDFLWVKPSEEGLEYAVSNSNTSFNFSWPLVNGKVHGFSSDSKEWDWRPGFRVGFGMYTNNDHWAVDAEWTYIRIKADSSVKIEGQGIFLPLFIQPILALDTVTLFDASARWSGDYNTFDLMIGKPHHLSRYFIVSPSFGLRGAWIDQDYLVRYSLDSTDNNQVNMIAKNNYYGFGLRGKFDGQFLLGSGWYIFGKIAASLLFGKFDTSQGITMRTIETGPSVDNSYNLEDDFYMTEPNVEMAFGFAWSSFFGQGQYNVALKVGYEFIHYWDQNQLRRFFDVTSPAAIDTVSRGDLSFNGLVASLAIEF